MNANPLKEESAIISAIVNGKEQAFTELYQLYAAKVYNTALSYTKNEEEAEEITQDVFVKIFKSIRKFKGNSSVSTWIYRITTNTSIDHVNKRKRYRNLKNELPDGEKVDFNHPGVLLENKEMSATLYQVMDCLADSQKTAFILSYIEGLPRQEVASIMETSLKAVESLLQRAKKKMRPELEKIYQNRRKSLI